MADVIAIIIIKIYFCFDLDREHLSIAAWPLTASSWPLTFNYAAEDRSTQHNNYYVSDTPLYTCRLVGIMLQIIRNFLKKAIKMLLLFLSSTHYAPSFYNFFINSSDKLLL